jgi:hypothetical protein
MDANTPFITSLIDDPRFVDVAEQILGKPVLGILTDGNYYVGDTGWHPDSRSSNIEAVKFTIYLDPLEARNGALRLIPGSHLEPLHSLMTKEPEATFGISREAVPAFVFESRPGDVLVFNQRVWHASFGGSTHRRMGIVDFHEDPQTRESEIAFQQKLQGHYRGFTDRWGIRQHYPEYWRTVSTPRHQHWVRRLHTLGCLDMPVQIEARG